jgi:hypothetical protein
MPGVIGPLIAVHYSTGARQIARSAQEISFAPGETERIEVDCYDGSTSARLNVTGAALVLTIDNAGGTDLLARQADLDNAANGDVSFPFTVADTQALAPGSYWYDVWIVWGDGSKNQLIPRSVFRLLPTAYQTTTAVTPTPSQTPLAQGPTGPTGPQGPVGSSILHGSGVPSSGLGANGDYYHDDLTSDFYAKSGGAWSAIANLKGNAGGPFTSLVLTRSGSRLLTVEAPLSGQGSATVFEGQPGSTDQRGGNLTVRAGASGGSTAQGADLILEGGAPGVGFSEGGDVIIRTHPNASPTSAGIDIGFAANCGEILFGHAPADDADDSGRVQFLGHVSTSITFARGLSTASVKVDRGAGQNSGNGLTITGGAGGHAGLGSPGGSGGSATVIGATGGDGTASLAPGKGGDVAIKGGVAGTRNGFGAATGATVTVEAGAGVGGNGNGAINVGSSGPAPSQINVGQTGVPLTLAGTIAGVFPAVAPYATTSAAGTNLWPTAPIPLVYHLTGFAGARAVILPTRAQIALAAGTCRWFVVSVDASYNGNTLFIYAPADGSKLSGKLQSDGTPWTLATAPGAHSGTYGGGARVWFDGADFWFI